ncbi:helix-turn-helix domain-containing protein [Gehongia tenuis]|uniref:Helix-turn-helix transcriptional regulator n=1 Tax=Gehongia tenuis TaxID=2763655 RepID=A0A926HLB5_9FIRM|nr:XRE family transcriptional regulator [Gehongia tenuis]MBC8531887.1 helix-turn-helix transcriptional regulator [Gehongia tenuis]
MQIGEKIKRLRVRYGLTQSELAARTDLSKGFISQLERDLTSPSIATLMDILECLGTNLRDFFNEKEPEKICFGEEDIFESRSDDMTRSVKWLIPSAQKNRMEPIMLTLSPGGETELDDPHEGEEFGHVLSGRIVLHVGGQKYRMKKGDSFYFKATASHCIENPGKREAVVLWVATPPSF